MTFLLTYHYFLLIYSLFAFQIHLFLLYFCRRQLNWILSISLCMARYQFGLGFSPVSLLADLENESWQGLPWQVLHTKNSFSANVPLCYTSWNK